MRVRAGLLLPVLVIIAVSGVGSLFAGGLNLNGVGAKANGMGGAFVGQADDLTAVFWNPGGLGRLEESEMILGASPVLPTGEYSLQPLGVDSTTKTTVYPGGVLGYGRRLSDRFVVAGLVSAPSGTGGRWHEEGLAPLTFGQTFTWDSSIALVAVSPAVAYELTPELSVGAALVLNFGWLDTKVPAAMSAGPVQIAEQTTEKMTGFGVGGTFGIHYAPSDRFAVGLTWRTPSTVEFSGDATNDLAPIIGGAVGAAIPNASGVKRTIRWPHWVGLGTSFHPHPRLTVNADVQYNNWGSLDSIGVTYDNAAWQQYLSSEATLRLEWKDNVLWRIGVAYDLTDSLTASAGYYYDPAPSPPETTNILMPTADFHGLSAGLGWRGQKSTIHLSVEYALGKRREVPLGPDAVMPGSHKYDLLIPQIVFTRRFGG